MLDIRLLDVCRRDPRTLMANTSTINISINGLMCTKDNHVRGIFGSWLDGCINALSLHIDGLYRSSLIDEATILSRLP